MVTERKQRSLAKAITWRICATITTIILVLVFTGNLLIALSVGSVEVIAKLIIYYLHERAWGSIAWGYEEKLK